MSYCYNNNVSNCYTICKEVTIVSTVTKVQLMREITNFNLISTFQDESIVLRLKTLKEKQKSEKMTKNSGTEKICEYSNSEIVFEYSEGIRIFEYPLTSILFYLLWNHL